MFWVSAAFVSMSVSIGLALHKRKNLRAQTA